MARLASIFGSYANQLQVVIDTSLAQFAPVWYTKYFGWAPAQPTLNFTSVIGRARIEAAASIVNRDSQTPQRSRQGLEKYSGEIAAIKEMIKMTESDYRDFLAMQAMAGLDDATKKQQLLDFLFKDVKMVGDSAHKRLDIMVLEAVSTGSITITAENNPDGITVGELDLLMSPENKKTTDTSWSDSANAKPLTDIEKIKIDANKRGIKFAKILMSYSLWLLFKNTKEVKDTMITFYYGRTNGGNPQSVTTLDKINEYMSANQYPMIEVVDEVIGIEKDGKINATQPFNEKNCSFIPAGQLGTIKNAVAIEQMNPVDKVRYATFNRALISKWSENEPFGEWSKVELNAFPAFEAIDSTYILKAILD